MVCVQLAKAFICLGLTSSDQQEHNTRLRLGKVHSGVFPPEHNLERFIKGLNKINSTWSSAISACSWKGVQCDASFRVTDVNWSKRMLTGNLSWSFLPHTLLFLDLSENRFQGEVSVCAMPADLRFLDLKNNEFHGCFPLADLPSTLLHCDISYNKFSGPITFPKPTQGAIKLRVLNVSRNRFFGQVNTTTFTSELQYVYLNNNALHGPIDLWALPRGMQILDLTSNSFSNVSKAIPANVRFYPQNG